MNIHLNLSKEEARIVAEFASAHGTSEEDCIRQAVRKLLVHSGAGTALQAAGERIQALHRDVQLHLMDCHRESRDTCDGCRMLMALLKDVRELLADIKHDAIKDSLAAGA